MSTSSPNPPPVSSPPNPPDSPEAIYTTLTTLLHTHRLSTLELEILPSTSTPTPILHDGLSLAISKKALIHTFLIARQLFLSTASSPQTPNPQHTPDLRSATKILLLYDPEHLSAANWRKRHLSHLARSNSPGQEENACGQHIPDSELRRAVYEEWAFLTSLLTSPLHRHAKSPTLWWHRCWLVRNYVEYLLPYDPVVDGSASGVVTAPSGLSLFLSAEMDVVLLAAERHRANYHAFHYGRRLLALHPGVLSGKDGEEVVEKVRKWCFAHPRDVSGWGFLAFLLSHDGLMANGVERTCLMGTASLKVQEFVVALEWKGESVEWFLREMADIAKQAATKSDRSTLDGIG
ncbi:hypothetical protein MMC18_001625 [Xylographa bjoerkii]|nr:hypothetical protein [Xylographa bjoerkii]